MPSRTVVAESNLCVEPGKTHIFRQGCPVATATLEHRSRGIRFWLSPRTYIHWPRQHEHTEQLFWLGPTTLRSSELVMCNLLTTLSRVVTLQWGHLGKDYKTVANFEWDGHRNQGVIGRLTVSGDIKYGDYWQDLVLTALVMLEREEARCM